MAERIDNPSFCTYAWEHRLVDTDGQTRLCCYTTERNGHVNTLVEDWNNDYMRDTRRKMVEGTPLSTCQECYRREAAGKDSPRTTFNRRHQKNDALWEKVERSIANDMVVDEPPAFFELRFGNLCNLQCKMCNGHFSSQILKDQKRLMKLDPEGYEKFYRDKSAIDFTYDWYENPEVWEVLDEMIPFIKRIHVTGGEPTLIEQHDRFMKRCIELGYADQIVIGINTNLTTIDDDLLALLGAFKHVSITCSMDGTGPTYDYIRYPGDWPTIRKNFIALLDYSRHSRFDIKINMVVQVFNMLTLDPCLSEFVELYEAHADKSTVFRIMLTCVSGPNVLRVDRMPEPIRRLSAERLRAWLAKYPREYLDTFFEHNAFQMILDQFDKGSSDKEDPQNFLNYCRFYDQNKKVTLSDCLPELKDMLERCVKEVTTP